MCQVSNVEEVHNDDQVTLRCLELKFVGEDLEHFLERSILDNVQPLDV